MVTDTAFLLPDPLTAPERRLCDAAARGELLAFDATAPEAERLIRPAVIEALMRNHATRLTGRGLRVQWALVAGRVDLTGLGAAEAPAPPLVLRDMTGPRAENVGAAPAGLDLNLTGAVLAELDLTGSYLTRIEASDLVLRQRLDLSRCRTTPAAHLVFDVARVGSDVFLNAAAVEGEVRFIGAGIGGHLTAQDARLINPDGVALNVYGATIKVGISLRAATVAGEVDLRGSAIGGQVSVEGAHLAKVGGVALNVDGATVKTGIFLRDATIDGEVRLLGAEIGGQLSVEGAHLARAGGVAGRRRHR